MTIRDIMIGDYVTFKECQNENPTIIEIVAIAHQFKVEADCLVSIDRDKACDIIEIDDGIVGIPLTTEILDKNGFINGEFYSEAHIGDWQIMSDGSHLAARSERGWCIDIPCQYVHELQHAFRMLGIEKEIEL